MLGRACACPRATAAAAPGRAPCRTTPAAPVPPCASTLQIHPEDAARLGLADGAPATVTADGGELTVPVEVTDTVRTDVVSLPHGRGHNRPGTRMSVAAEQPGVNVNRFLDGGRLGPLSGTAVLNGIPVTVTPSR